MPTLDISRYFKKDAVVVELRAKTKTEAISELLDRLFAVNPPENLPISKQEVLKQVIERESLQSTGVGDHIAFPHARIKGWKDFTVVLGTSSNGLDFTSIDKKPVHFICLMISSHDEPYIILQTMAAVARFMSVHKDIKAFLQNKSPADILKEFTTKSVEATRVIIARDIMRPVKEFVRLDYSVEDVARKMHLNRQDVLPVLDNENNFFGEITCFHIFEYSIPDFFRQLNTVSFIKHFDPFEKYFKMKHTLTVKDILKSKGTAIPENTTLVEIIFQLAIKNKPKLFVVKDGRLVGEIDRFSIIDKILFF